MRVDLVDLGDRREHARGHRRRRRIAREFPGEDAVVGGERLAVVPAHALLELPDDRLAVGRQAAVLACRDFGSKDRNQVGVVVPYRERLVEDARAFLVLGAVRKVRLKQGGALPPQHPQCAAAAALGRLVVRYRLRLGDAGVHQHHRGHRRGEAEADHLLDETATGQLARTHVVDQCTQFTLLHHDSPRWVVGSGTRRPAAHFMLSIGVEVHIRVGPETCPGRATIATVR